MYIGVTASLDTDQAMPNTTASTTKAMAPRTNPLGFAMADITGPTNNANTAAIANSKYVTGIMISTMNDSKLFISELTFV
jgi:hypothetical protein